MSQRKLLYYVVVGICILVLFIGGAIMADKSSFSLYGVYQADGIVAGQLLTAGKI